jgi:hypothetical protein
LLRKKLAEVGISEVQVEKVEPTLEDVFLALAGESNPMQNRTTING